MIKKEKEVKKQTSVRKFLSDRPDGITGTVSEMISYLIFALHETPLIVGI